MKRAIRRVIQALGYDIRRRGPAPPAAPLSRPFEAALLALLAMTDRLRIVQVGANDGVINDPLHDFLRRFPERTEVTLIEPQRALIPYLEANYAFHPARRIFNGAVGPAGVLCLHSITPQAWDKIDAPYARDWPAYRAPTGVTSTDRDHVIRWLRTYGRPGLDVEAAVVREEAPSLPLPDLLDRLSVGRRIDVLQVDAEGFDDEVIFHAAIEETQPRLINFEMANLPAPRFQALTQHLQANGFTISEQGGDCLAVRTGA
jgi:FkbM family methyltransferase